MIEATDPKQNNGTSLIVINKGNRHKFSFEIKKIPGDPTSKLLTYLFVIKFKKKRGIMNIKVNGHNIISITMKIKQFNIFFTS